MILFSSFAPLPLLLPLISLPLHLGKVSGTWLVCQEKRQLLAKEKTLSCVLRAWNRHPSLGWTAGPCSGSGLLPREMPQLVSLFSRMWASPGGSWKSLKFVKSLVSLPVFPNKCFGGLIINLMSCTWELAIMGMEHAQFLLRENSALQFRDVHRAAVRNLGESPRRTEQG